jgi:hypothetical protein
MAKMNFGLWDLLLHHVKGTEKQNAKSKGLF